jgi:hypothetical protein
VVERHVRDTEDDCRRRRRTDLTGRWRHHARGGAGARHADDVTAHRRVFGLQLPAEQTGVEVRVVGGQEKKQVLGDEHASIVGGLARRPTRSYDHVRTGSIDPEAFRPSCSADAS